MLLYVLKREEREYMRDLALAQIQLNKDKGAERFNEFRRLMFPWIETAKKRDEDEHKKILKEVVSRGPLVVRAAGQQRLKSRLVQRVERQDPKVTRDQQNALYSRLGKSIPV
jgi:hypothetical protein